jgi:2-methylaconitate cis-trans-isomerase PrpF
MLNLKHIALGATLAIATAGAFAQPATATPRVDQREANQQARINQGVASGELTRHETKKLEKEQAKIHRTEAKAKADGVVTPQERERLNKMQNKASQDIKNQKHDAQTR